MRNPEDIRAAMRNVADSFHAAKLTVDKCDTDEEKILGLLRRVDQERSNAERRVELYHQQFDALQDELDRVMIAQAEAMVTP